MTKNERGEASCLPSFLLSVAAPAASDRRSPGRNPSDRCFSCSESTPVLRRGPRRASEPAGLRDEPPILTLPARRPDFLGFGPPMGAMPETEGRFPAPGRDVATAATPAVTRNASGVLFEAAAAGLADNARRGG